MVKIAIFASGSGTNFDNIMQKISTGLLSHVEVIGLFTDQPQAACVERAHKHNVKVYAYDPKTYTSQKEYESVIYQTLKQNGVKWIVLAGYMRLIGETLLNAYEGHILNIHPSLLPKYKGKHAIEQALNNREQTTGTTVHYVDTGMDTGEIIAQRECPIYPNDQISDLEQRIKTLEYELYPEVIQKIIR
ncbi:phosphoribosylglycinamide formyltransferase [Staphylococcus chromogenes]|uniref:phosphoribosylglycinamide formyltransferase n=1 Tax=Staphylococcus chromogenes TaxID=46126 RepID=UPI003B00B195